MNAWIAELVNTYHSFFVFGFSFSMGFVAGCVHERKRLRKLAEEGDQ